jgi:hypothetical protein
VFLSCFFLKGTLTIFTKPLNHAVCATLLLASTVSAQSTTAGFSELLTLHPAQSSTSPNGWNRALGQFGESLVRNFERVRGNTVFNLNVGEHGIDGLVSSVGPGGKVDYKLIEVKTLQHGTEFQLSDTKLGKQLTHPVIEDRLATAAAKHPDAATRKVAAEALERFRANPASLKAELHGVSVGDNRCIVRAVDSATGTIKGEIASPRVTDVLKNLSKRASSEEVRRMATRHLAEFDQLQSASKLRIVKGDNLSREMAKLAGVEEKQMGNAVTEAAEHIRVPGQSRWIKAGGKVFKFVGHAAGPAGVVIGASVFTAEVADIEQRLERGEITLEQANAEHAKLAVRAAGTVGGAVSGVMAGAAIGTFICPGAGTVIGGIVGGVGGAIGTDLVMAATGLTDALADYLQPGVDGIRKACAFLKDEGYQVAVAGRDQLCEWVGPELFDETIATLGTTIIWVRERAGATAVAVKDAAVAVKDQLVEVGGQARDAVAGGAAWTWDKAKSGYGVIRSWLP